MSAAVQIRSHRDLIVWQKAMDLVEAVYKATASFPKEETYALTSQIRRAVVSIPANIAEGQGRRLTKEYLYFLANARVALRTRYTLGNSGAVEILQSGTLFPTPRSVE